MPDLIKVTTGRRTLVARWCGVCGTRNEGSDRECSKCSGGFIERHAQVHTSERAVVYINPATGERRTPPRADEAMPEIYARQGFERQEIMSMTAYEKSSGTVHEASNFAPGSEPNPDREGPEARAPKEVVDSIMNEIRAANQSGPWTMGGEVVG